MRNAEWYAAGCELVHFLLAIMFACHLRPIQGCLAASCCVLFIWLLSQFVSTHSHSYIILYPPPRPRGREGGARMCRYHGTRSLSRERAQRKASVYHGRRHNQRYGSSTHSRPGLWCSCSMSTAAQRDLPIEHGKTARTYNSCCLCPCIDDPEDIAALGLNANIGVEKSRKVSGGI